MVKHIETGCDSIFRVDSLLNKEVCEELYTFMLSKMSETPRFTNMPWHDNESFYFWNLESVELKRSILAHRKQTTEIVSEKFKRKLYPEFTDLVLWRTGRDMPRHKDDGYDGEYALHARKISSVTYLNEDFTGGETFIATGQGTDYISNPKQGSFVCYLSNETNAHGVNRVLSGNRVTLPIWFTDDILKSEDIRLQLL